MSVLRRQLASSEATLAATDAGAPQTQRSFEEYMSEALVMLRISYLERLHYDLGRMEAKSIVQRCSCPRRPSATTCSTSSRGDAADPSAPAHTQCTLGQPFR
jgi:hypothetical protein